MRVGMICIGDELLDGRTQDRNIQAAGKSLGALGLELERAWVVLDGQDTIREALEEASAMLDVVLVSGGLGPTADDVTREAAAALVAQPLVESAEAKALLEQRFATRGIVVTGNNARQCLFPQGAQVILNGVGSAAGFRLEHQQAELYFVPGVPRECAWFLEQPIHEALQARVQGRWPHRRSVQVFGLPESHVELKLDGIEELAKDVGGKVAYCARFPIIEVTLKAEHAEGLQALEQLVEERLEAWLVGDEAEDLAARVGRLLIEADARVTTAESCTAGMIAAALTETPGSSAWLDMGFVTYSNQAKQTLVGVQPQTLERFGAVSLQVAGQMAAGARERAEATFALAVSGVAGPGGGSEAKPVGTVCFALSAPEGTYLYRALFKNRERGPIRTLTTYTALTLLLWRLQGRLMEHDEVMGPFPQEQIWSLEGPEALLEREASTGA